jgi:hypothetical protein
MDVSAALSFVQHFQNIFPTGKWRFASMGSPSPPSGRKEMIEWSLCNNDWSCSKLLTRLRFHVKPELLRHVFARCCVPELVMLDLDTEKGCLVPNDVLKSWGCLAIVRTSEHNRHVYFRIKPEDGLTDVVTRDLQQYFGSDHGSNSVRQLARLPGIFDSSNHYYLDFHNTNPYIIIGFSYYISILS